ncbi:zinc ribbon domain-containing protein [Nocardioides yefusunii]|uniref:Zinc ribbon domain-containing protein n=1 Tax=Nocardioides yefusunii TaxID=2500546 RepID=A0ABW1QUQ4_9ACTN|nr:C4-type zinc ribbon domain-containing protein [Nocardioides yefusunii]
MKLLEIQEIDSRLLQLRHRRNTLPQLAEIAGLADQHEEVVNRFRDAQILVEDLEIDAAKAESDVEQVRVRRERDRKRVDEGLVPAKDLTRLNYELESLERRVTTLEDEQLEVMENLEQARAALEQVTQELTAFEQRVADLEAERDAEWAEIDKQIKAVEITRGPATAGMPENLMALYDRMREQKAGLGAALLTRRECGGCRLTLDHDAIEEARAAAPDDVVRCEECSRILVRNEESGL